MSVHVGYTVTDNTAPQGDSGPSTLRFTQSYTPAKSLQISPDTDAGTGCQIVRCRDERQGDWPVCFKHAMLISRAYNELLADTESPAAPTYPPVVYYLMVGPTTVKIGTTRNLTQRLKSMRTEGQYVVALERGSLVMESERHHQFAADRIGRREDFHLSDELKAHIESLQPERDAMLGYATTRCNTVSA